MKSKKFVPFCAAIVLLIPLLSNGAINPLYKECMQRGYTVSGDSCAFPDGSQCLLEDFNSGNCGQEWMTSDYCIPEGKYVWDADKCCEGLVAYLPDGVSGQATCQPKGATFLKKIFFDSYIGVLLLALVLGGLLFFFKRKRGEDVKK